MKKNLSALSLGKNKGEKNDVKANMLHLSPLVLTLHSCLLGSVELKLKYHTLLSLLSYSAQSRTRTTATDSTGLCPQSATGELAVLVLMTLLSGLRL